MLLSGKRVTSRQCFSTSTLGYGDVLFLEQITSAGRLLIQNCIKMIQRRLSSILYNKHLGELNYDYLIATKQVETKAWQLICTDRRYNFKFNAVTQTLFEKMSIHDLIK